MDAKEQQPRYGNWIPKMDLLRIWCAFGIILCILWLNITLKGWRILSCVLGAGAFALGCAAAYLQSCYYAYAFHGGGVMGKIHQFVLSRLPWDGKGVLLDIGCGSGALTISCAKKFVEAEIIGLDQWGSGWGYSLAQCQMNAEQEGIKTIKFVSGNAAELPFPEEEFDAVISNLVFHEVVQEKDKRKLVLEALRVLKKGGAFSFHDVFEDQNLYGNMLEFCELLREEGISSVYYEAHSETQSFIPSCLRKPIMLHNLGILYGEK